MVQVLPKEESQIKFSDSSLVRLAVQLGARIVGRSRLVRCSACHKRMARDEWTEHRCGPLHQPALSVLREENTVAAQLSSQRQKDTSTLRAMSDEV